MCMHNEIVAHGVIIGYVPARSGVNRSSPRLGSERTWDLPGLDVD